MRLRAASLCLEGTGRVRDPPVDLLLPCSGQGDRLGVIDSIAPDREGRRTCNSPASRLERNGDRAERVRCETRAADRAVVGLWEPARVQSAHRYAGEHQWHGASIGQGDRLGRADRSIGTLPNAREAVERVATGRTVVPVSVTEPETPGAATNTRSNADLAVLLLGVKVTLTVQFPPAARPVPPIGQL